MADEWVKVELYGVNNDGEPRRYTIADGISVSKGTLLKVTDARQASGSATINAPIAGVASEDKIAGDGTTSIALWTDGIFEAKASGNITAGQQVLSAEANKVHQFVAPAQASYAAVLGYALETATDAEVINVRLKV